MTYVIAICVDHEEDVAANLTNRLHADFTVLATIVLSLSVGPRKMRAAYSKPKPRSSKVRRLLASSHSKSIVRFKRSLIKDGREANWVCFAIQCRPAAPFLEELTLRLFVLALA